MDEIFFEINLLRTECVKFIEEQNVKIDALKEQWLEKYCPIKVGNTIASGDPNFYFHVDKIRCVFTNYGAVPQRIFWEAVGVVRNLKGDIVEFRGLKTFTVGEMWFNDKGFHENK